MEHLKFYEDPIFEKMGIPDILADYVNRFNEEITIDIWRLSREHQAQIDNRTISKETARKETTGIINFVKDSTHPFSSIKYTLSIELKPGVSWTKEHLPFAVEGGYAPKIKGDGDDEIEARIEIKYNEVVAKRGLKPYISIWMEYLSETLFHELLHAYEDMKRKEHGLGIRSKNILLSAGPKILIEKYPENSIRKFLHTLYTSVDFEINARVSEIYPLLKKIIDPKERLAAIKKSGSWDDAEALCNFNSQTFINNLYKELIENDVPTNELDYQVSKIINGLMDDFVGTSKELVNLFDDEDVDNPEVLKQIRKELEFENNKNLKILSKQPTEYFKYWEKEFHKKGEHLKRKLLKLVSY